jgi:hypothetical protein
MKFLGRTLVLIAIITIVSFPSLSQEGGKPSSPIAPQEPPPPAVEYNPSAWKVFSSSEGRFTIMFPGTPTEKNNSSNITGGRVANHEFTLKTTAFYGISYTDFPVDVEQEAAIRKQILDAVRDIVAAQTKGKVLSEEDISLDGHPSRRIKLAFANGGIMRVIACAVGKRMYQVFVITPREALAPDGGKFDEMRTNKFLNSFKSGNSGNGEKIKP